MTAQRRARRAVIVALTVGSCISAPWWSAPGTAVADAGGPECPLAMILMCKFLPVAPDLDEDVDLTQQSPVVNPPTSPPDSTPGS